MKNRLDAIIRLALKYDADALNFNSVSSKNLEVYALINGKVHKLKPAEQDYKLIKELMKVADVKINLKKPHDELYHTDFYYPLDGNKYDFHLTLELAKTFIKTATINLIPAKQKAEDLVEPEEIVVPVVEEQHVDFNKQEPVEVHTVHAIKEDDAIAQELKGLTRDNLLLSKTLTKACQKLANASIGMDYESIRTYLLDETYKELTHEQTT